MTNHSPYVIAYDVSCDRERGRVDKVLQQVGFCVQKSVFEARLNRCGHQRLVGSLETIELKTGFVPEVRRQRSILGALSSLGLH